MTLLPIVHPGELLKEYLEQRGQTVEGFAALTELPAAAVRDLCNGDYPLDPGIAGVLSRHIGHPAHYWENAQKAYEASAIALSVGGPARYLFMPADLEMLFGRRPMIRRLAEFKTKHVETQRYGHGNVLWRSFGILESDTLLVSVGRHWQALAELEEQWHLAGCP